MTANDPVAAVEHGTGSRFQATDAIGWPPPKLALGWLSRPPRVTTDWDDPALS